MFTTALQPVAVATSVSAVFPLDGVKLLARGVARIRDGGVAIAVGVEAFL